MKVYQVINKASEITKSVYFSKLDAGLYVSNNPQYKIKEIELINSDNLVSKPENFCEVCGENIWGELPHAYEGALFYNGYYSLWHCFCCLQKAVLEETELQNTKIDQEQLAIHKKRSAIKAPLSN